MLARTCLQVEILICRLATVRIGEHAPNVDVRRIQKMHVCACELLRGRGNRYRTALISKRIQGLRRNCRFVRPYQIVFQETIFRLGVRRVVIVLGNIVFIFPLHFGCRAVVNCRICNEGRGTAVFRLVLRINVGHFFVFYKHHVTNAREIFAIVLFFQFYNRAKIGIITVGEFSKACISLFCRFILINTCTRFDIQEVFAIRNQPFVREAAAHQIGFGND